MAEEEDSLGSSILDQLRPSLQALHIDCDSSADLITRQTQANRLPLPQELHGTGMRSLFPSHLPLSTDDETLSDTTHQLPLRHQLVHLEKLRSLVNQAPYDLVRRLALSRLYAQLNYPDLAAGEAYKALLLVDEVADESSEYHGPASDALQNNLQRSNKASAKQGELEVSKIQVAACASTTCSKASYEALIVNLCELGCYRSATQFCIRMLRQHPPMLHSASARLVLTEFCSWCGREDVPIDLQNEVENLPELGWARRELYPWNDHEPDRTSEDALQLLNGWMSSMAPKLEVRATNLPMLSRHGARYVLDSRIVNWLWSGPQHES